MTGKFNSDVSTETPGQAFIGRPDIFLMMHKPKPADDKKPFFFRLHNTQGRTTLAACDESLMGKKIRHGEAKFEICPEFYGREKAGAGKIVEMAREAHTCNFVGKEIIAALAAAGVISGKGAILIGGKVPHVQTFRF